MARHNDLDGAKILPFKRRYTPVRDYATYAILTLAFLQVVCLVYLIVITTKL